MKSYFSEISDKLFTKLVLVSKIAQSLAITFLAEIEFRRVPMFLTSTVIPFLFK